MNIKVIKLDSLKNIDELVDSSFNGTAFCYKYFLKLHKVEDILCALEEEKMIAFMPLFIKNNELLQSTMYVPYGGPIFLFNEDNYRRSFIMKRKIVDKFCKYLTDNLSSLCFSFDVQTLDIIPCVRNKLIPEVRYTYKIDLRKPIEEIYQRFGGDRKKDIKRAKRANLLVIEDKEINFFDIEKALVWEKNYGNESSANFVKEYLKESIKLNRGTCFIAKANNNVVGGIAVTWDKRNCYIMHSHYDKSLDIGIITNLYYYLIKYLKDNKLVEYLDFEGSVFPEIEQWNLSFGAKQYIYFNFYWQKEHNEEIFSELYDYGSKNIE
ncbi:MAG: hypothetical protein PHO63_06215 [Bacilli bacterium]|nr:hypothetical protein [Bacilli bacterium]